jgi:hypothetical protein
VLISGRLVERISEYPTLLASLYETLAIGMRGDFCTFGGMCTRRETKNLLRITIASSYDNSTSMRSAPQCDHADTCARRLRETSLRQQADICSPETSNPVEHWAFPLRLQRSISKAMYIGYQVSLCITLAVCVPYLQRDEHDTAKCTVWRKASASAHEGSLK